jgi:hypothetical protein
MRNTYMLCLCAAVAIAAMSVPAAAQWSTSSTSFEGATHEMQKRGPRSDVLGPGWGGEYVVTEPGYRRGYRVHRRHYHPPAYGYYAPAPAYGYYYR